MTPQWCSYVRNISSTGSNEFSLPPPSSEVLYSAGDTGSKTREREADRERESPSTGEYPGPGLSWLKKTSSYRGETRQMALTTGIKTHGLTEREIKKGEKGRMKERKRREEGDSKELDRRTGRESERQGYGSQR